ncbi:hypothetical protein, partial [Acinetobacter nosocomialis]|uniref:hypothetical protein n=1 Tax=Acinetobacter nosocomialis TaxID=106654 RepID=UPI001C0D25C4
TSYPSCNLNFSNLGKLYLQRLYATKPLHTTNEIKRLHFVINDSKITTYKSSKFNKNNKVSF